MIRKVKAGCFEDFDLRIKVCARNEFVLFLFEAYGIFS